MAKHTAIIIGVGAIGRQVAVQLAAAGIRQLYLVDFDKVEEPNLGTQGYLVADLGLSKVEAVTKMCAAINPEVSVRAVDKEFAGIPSGIELLGIPAMFCCVDSMAARRIIWTACRAARLPFFVDGRMSGEVIRILTATSEEEYAAYEPNLFDDSEAFQARCTQVGSIFTSNIAGGLLVSQFSKFLRKMPFLEKDFFFNMLSMEIIRP